MKIEECHAPGLDWKLKMLTKSKKIVLWGREDLLIASVGSLLASKYGWEVVSISNTGDVDALVLAVDTIHADTVIIHRQEYHVPISLLIQLLEDLSSLRVIIVGLENNAMEVFNKQTIYVKETSDLISVLENFR